jgi:hypothetical protein
MISDEEIKKAANQEYGNGKYLTEKEEGFRKGAEWALGQVKNCSIPNVVGSSSLEVKYCRDGKRVCDCMGLICSK